MTDTPTSRGLSVQQTLWGHPHELICITWSPNGRFLATRDTLQNVQIWDFTTGHLRQELTGNRDWIRRLCWAPDGKSIRNGDQVPSSSRIWRNAEAARNIVAHPGTEKAPLIAWNWECSAFALVSDHRIEIRAPDGQKVSQVITGFGARTRTAAWSPSSEQMALGSDDCIIRIVDMREGRIQHSLEGHTGPITSVAFSPDRNILASRSTDGTMRLWWTETWKPIALQDEAAGKPRWCETPTLAFHPNGTLLATIGPKSRSIRVWSVAIDVDPDAQSIEPTIRYTSAKIVIVGESNVGKSCLALRLAEDRYEEQGTTHGMKFWPISPLALSSAFETPAGEQRDVVLWDMGGQDEYRLVHQLFLHDTTLALLLIDPTRGRTAFEEVEGWNKRLQKQLRGRGATKVLVSTKRDNDQSVVDRIAVDRLIRHCEIDGYVETSAKQGHGIGELRSLIATSLRGDDLAKTSRPHLFQRIREEIEKHRVAGEVVILYADLERQIRELRLPEYDPTALSAVVEQLAVQGVITDTRLSTGQRALVLQIGEVERYAGALIIAARNNLSGVAAIEQKAIAAQQVDLPGINARERLPGLKERVVLECVVQLLIEHGICLSHEGLLVFPSMFQPTERDEADVRGQSVSLYYDFSGAIDNIYSSLVAALALGAQFGRVRLWDDRAEFERPGLGVSGLRKIVQRNGFAHLDVYFESITPKDMRDLFISFVEDHLSRYGVEIYERVEITCACGFSFPDDLVRRRMGIGESDVGCPDCDRRTMISEGALSARQRDPELENRTWALRTLIQEKRKVAVQTARQVFARTPMHTQPRSISRILHLSDLHFTVDTDPQSALRPLVADLRGSRDGLGLTQLDYLVISGDFSERAQPEEFERAREFVSLLIAEFQLTANRCVFVPGNHDVDWDEPVYEWLPRRKVNVDGLPAGSYVTQGDGYLVRQDERYHSRFKSFSDAFYHLITQREYPPRNEAQATSHFFPEAGIQILGLNSCWAVDEFHRDRAGIHEGALARGLSDADEDLRRATVDGKWKPDSGLIRIAVWHHAITGNNKIYEDAFVEQLQAAGFRICLHGDIHELRPDVIGYRHLEKLHVIGGGSFGAKARARPESTPRMYNLIEADPRNNSLRVRVRSQEKSGGAFRGYPGWQTGEGTWSDNYLIEL